MKKLLKNAVGDVLTSILGSMAGLPELIAGIQAHDATMIIKGAGLLLLGLVSNTNETK